MRYRGAKYGRIFTGFIIIAFALSVLSLFVFFWQDHTIKIVRSWPTTEAVVLKHEITTFTNGFDSRTGYRISRNNVLRFAFSYQVNGQNFISERFYPSATFMQHTDAINFPVGRHFLASYDPLAPETAVVDSGSLHYGLLLFGIICLGLSVAGLIYNLNI
jgi:hypothetical protein